MFKVSVVVPVFNEEGVMDEFLARILKVADSLKDHYQFEWIFALDPSTDRTEEILARYAEKDTRIKYLKFSRRIGQPLATLAGIHHVTGDACVIIDADLQDPPELIPQLLEKWRTGYDVVLPQRRTRKGETFVKVAISSIGYSLINKITSVKIPKEIGDFRLIGRRVVEEINKLREHHGLLRGMVAFVGFKQTTVLYDREMRRGGRSKYNPFVGSLRIGINSLVCFSTFLLSLSFLAGFTLMALSFLPLLYGLARQMITHQDVRWGMISIVSSIFFVGGVQLLFAGILGEYIGRIYDEVQGRPRYIVDQKVNFEEMPSPSAP